MNNYTIIEGQTYDQRLIDYAQKLILEKSIEEISTVDIAHLWEHTRSSERPNDIEINTWRYLMTAHRFSLAAASWLRSHLPPEGPNISPLIINIVRRQYDLANLVVNIEGKDVQAQIQLPENIISFRHALSSAMQLYIDDYETPNAPASLLMSALPEKPEEDYNLKAFMQERLHRVFQRGILSLIPLMPDHQQQLPLPAAGESIHECWMFHLSLEHFPNCDFWAIVPRDGKLEAYQYSKSNL